MSIFIVFEYINPVVWTSEKFYKNSYILYINKKQLFLLNIFLKNEIFFSNSTLIENSAIDNKKNTLLFKNINSFKNNTKIFLFYLYYFFTTKSKLLILIDYNTNSQVTSIDKIYKSAGWLEREVGEMFKIQYRHKIDTRRLLLDYTKNENPLLKDYPVGGFNDVYYSFFEDQVVSTTTTFVEL